LLSIQAEICMVHHRVESFVERCGVEGTRSARGRLPSGVCSFWCRIVGGSRARSHWAKHWGWNVLCKKGQDRSSCVSKSIWTFDGTKFVSCLFWMPSCQLCLSHGFPLMRRGVSGSSISQAESALAGRPGGTPAAKPGDCPGACFSTWGVTAALLPRDIVP
jgi:hypothetical protein